MGESQAACVSVVADYLIYHVLRRFAAVILSWLSGGVAGSLSPLASSRFEFLYEFSVAVGVI